MNIKPILFNTDMARAILDGRKTVTRRVVKPQPNYSLAKMPLGPHKGEWHEYNESSLKDPTITSPWGYQYTSPYRPGDILYVRETWRIWRAHRYDADAHIEFKAGGDSLVLRFPHGCTDSVDRDDYDRFIHKWGVRENKWHPSIHMPREAARIFLRVTDVRVERLQDITEEQAQAEGLHKGWTLTDKSTPASTAKQAFMWVWNMTIKPSDRSLCGWIGNPWVWVIEFERITKEEAMS